VKSGEEVVKNQRIKGGRKQIAESKGKEVPKVQREREEKI